MMAMQVQHVNELCSIIFGCTSPAKGTSRASFSPIHVWHASTGRYVLWLCQTVSIRVKQKHENAKYSLNASTNLFASLKHQLGFVVGQILRLNLQALWSLSLALGKLEIVVHEQVDHDSFDLSRCEESARACVSTVAKSHARWMRRCVGHRGG